MLTSYNDKFHSVKHRNANNTHHHMFHIIIYFSYQYLALNNINSPLYQANNNYYHKLYIRFNIECI